MERVWRLPWANWFFRSMHSVPVGTGGAVASLPALRAALGLLRAGEIVGVFPEGRVQPEGPVAGAREGAALLAVRARAPIIPLVVHGSARAWPHGRRFPRPARVLVRFGPALVPPPARGGAALGELTARIEQTLNELAAAVEEV
jgi:1-acyl-sn-glycerol-3-phosphate acyltransferase